MTTPSRPITFVVPGQAPIARGAGDALAPRPPAEFERGRVKGSVELRATRGGGSDVALDAVPGTDVVVMEIAGGPTLVLHPETARDLLLAQDGGARARGSAAPAAVDSISVPFRLQWGAIDDGVTSRSTRGSFGDVLVSKFHVLTDLFEGPAADFTASKIVEKVDAQVTDGVYALESASLPVLKDAGHPLATLPASSTGGPALVLVHGTFSTTQGTFQKLWANHPGRVETLFRFYGNRVYGLDHSTLGRSPIENALTLVRALRPGSRLHLVTHSRGGLVAEVLAKVCGHPALGAGDQKIFAGGDYEEQLDALKELTSLVAKGGIVVERVTRVACPVRGTLLASKRLDAYVSVLEWSLKLAGIPVAPAIVDFLGMVAQRRADVSIMPGLAAQIPDSPLVRWLHGGGADIAGDLRVIAGDLAGDSMTSWLKTLLSDAFYWTDNDLVVQTRGMYGGAPRAGGATFLLDQGGKVSHFNYFANERTAGAMVDALTQAVPPGFRKIGPLSWSGESSTGVRGAPNAGARASSADLPAVIIVPDVLASHLRIGGERVWLSRRSGNEFGRLAYPGDGKTKVEPDGIVEAAYAALSRHLARTHEVISFAYDWRLPIEDEARRLAAVVSRAIGDRAKHGAGTTATPVRIIGHGMGGLLARAVQLVAPDVWDALLAHDDARILLLGVPNEGSWTPMQVLSGDETFGSLLQALAPPFRDQETRRIMAGFPGFMQLQAGLTDPALKLDDPSTWEALAKADVDRVRAKSVWHSDPRQIDAYQWGVPTRDALEQAVRFRRKLDKQAEAGLGTHSDQIVAVVGTARSTPDGFENGAAAFVYRDLVNGGDGYITTRSALLPGARAWSVAAEHRSLTTNPDAFEAYAELLATGSTRGLPRMAATSGARGGVAAPTYERTRPSRRPTAPPPAEMADLLSAGLRDASLGSGLAGPALPVTVINGNLKFVNQPLMLGHYRSMALTGTEWVMDKLIGGTMNQLIWLRQYPDQPTSHQIFLNRAVNPDNPLQTPRPEAVIVVGLGEEGKLTTTDLTSTVTQGVIAWAQRLVEQSSAPAQFELAATLIGSGGAGISAGQAAVAVAQGVRDANLRLIDASWPSVGHLYLIELYLDRAAEAWRALQVQSTSSSGQFRVTETVKAGTGAIPRPLDSSYRGADYDFVTAASQRDARGDPVIAYRLDTKRARTEVHASAMQAPLMRELVLSASNDRNGDAQIGRTLFQLLIPPEMEPFMGGTTSMVLEVDSGSAGIPWELLDSGVGTRGGADPRPWAIRSKLLRKLRTDDYRLQVVDADAEAHVLVIGEPDCDAKRYPRLPAAQEEARAVAQEFIDGSDVRGARTQALPPDKVKALIADDRGGADARTVMNAVLERDWRIVHIAGHGEPPEHVGSAPGSPGGQPPGDGDPRGVVLSNGTFLGPREINKMRVVPELVFVNCCHLAARNIAQLLDDGASARYDRARFAAGVAESLIRIGVRCVIAAGWAVDDEPAKVFATTFYDQLLAGRRFIDAVSEARAAAYALGGNTWAAYQCYGDPDWEFRWRTSDAQVPASSGTPASGAVKPSSGATANLAAEFSVVASVSSLTLALDTIAIRSKYDKLNPADQRRRIAYLEETFAGRWQDNGAVAEAFGRACAEVGDRLAAIKWYQRAVNAGDGSATMKASEQLGNLRARVALEMVERADRRVRRLERANASATDLDAARKKLRSYVVKARREVEEARSLLEPLAVRWPSVERASLCGSAWKRRAMIERIAGDAKAEDEALAEMKSWYERAEQRAIEQKDPAVYYPALNRMAAELLVDAKARTWQGFDPKPLAALRDTLETKTRDDPDFWSVVGRTELVLYEALASRTLASRVAEIASEYDDLWARVSALGAWDSMNVQLRFVLSRYRERVTGAEREAVDALLTHVGRLVARAKRVSSHAG
jgi:tetratricopeptide (TPR) repeat protein/triacylglycerol esterase/lipase EstA (alpha/beta hydrolase family)